MKWTNNHGVPDAVASAVINDDYTKGDSDISVTGLIGPPQIAKLFAEHGDEIEKDVMDQVWTLLGKGVHNILEGHGEGIEEERLYATWNGLKISGKSDHLNPTNSIDDYKVTSVWSVIHGVKEDWESQLNLYRWLWAENGFKVDSLRIVVILRDWSKHQALKADYPDHPIQCFDIPIWDDNKLHAYLDKQVADHTAKEPRPCTNAERWHEGDKWAVRKAANKKAWRVMDTLKEAQAIAGPEHVIDYREGGYKRCESYCDVAQFCPQLNFLEFQPPEGDLL